MIEVRLSRSNGKLVAFHIEGHAGFDEHGRDLVCCAVSAISQTTLIGMEEVVKVKPKYVIKDGLLSLSIANLHNEELDKCQVLMETMMLGLKSMELGGYGEYIKVIEEEV